MSNETPIDEILSQYNTVLAGTGSRNLVKQTPEHQAKVMKWLHDKVLLLDLFDETIVISGGAQGFDTALAVTAESLDVPYILALPSPSYGEYYWRDHPYDASQTYDMFEWICDKAAAVHYVCDNHMYGKANFIRNQWMVDHANNFAVYNPKSAGTKHCLKLIQTRGLPYQIFEEG